MEETHDETVMESNDAGVTGGAPIERGVKDRQSPPPLHILYILYDTKGRTYNGYTVNLQRRLRQHNREICGGAKYTTSKVSPMNCWKVLLTITSPRLLDKNVALSLEWSIKYPTNKRPRPRQYSTPKGRIESLPHVFNNPKFTHLENFHVTLYSPEFENHLQNTLKDLHHVSIIRG